MYYALLAIKMYSHHFTPNYKTCYQVANWHVLNPRWYELWCGQGDHPSNTWWWICLSLYPYFPCHHKILIIPWFLACFLYIPFILIYNNLRLFLIVLTLDMAFSTCSRCNLSRKNISSLWQAVLNTQVKRYYWGKVKLVILGEEGE